METEETLQQRRRRLGQVSRAVGGEHSIIMLREAVDRLG